MAKLCLSRSSWDICSNITVNFHLSSLCTLWEKVLGCCGLELADCNKAYKSEVCRQVIWKSIRGLSRPAKLAQVSMQLCYFALRFLSLDVKLTERHAILRIMIQYTKTINRLFLVVADMKYWFRDEKYLSVYQHRLTWESVTCIMYTIFLFIPWPV